MAAQKLLLCCAAFSFPATGQTLLDLSTQVKPSTKPVKTGSALPSTCNPGDLFLFSGAAPGSNIFACLASGSWTPQTGQPGALSIQSNGTPVGNETVQNYIGGNGLIYALSDTGTRVDMVNMIDPAVVLTHSVAQSGRDLLCQSAGGSTQTYTCHMSPSLTAYQPGMQLNWIPDVSSGGAATLAIDGLPPLSVKMPDGATDPPPGSLPAGRLAQIWYDGTLFRLVNSGGSGQIRNIIQQFYLGGSALTSGLTYYQSLSFACTITQWKVLADQGGSAVVKVWKSANGVFPTSAASISTSGLTSSASFSANLTDFTTTAINAGDNLAFYLASVSGGAQQVSLTLECK
ncbi:MAG TPA: hypothetical protein VKB79_21215 [Bryobacteraceae bacterium]|nr:hypothetical protein [Bryobacteraceae bacterium]